MTDLVLDDSARALSVGELLDKAANGSLRLVSPDGASRYQLTPTPPGGRGPVSLGSGEPSPTGKPRGEETFPEVFEKLNRSLPEAERVPFEAAADRRGGTTPGEMV